MGLESDKDVKGKRDKDGKGKRQGWEMIVTRMGKDRDEDGTSNERLDETRTRMTRQIESAGLGLKPTVYNITVSTEKNHPHGPFITTTVPSASIGKPIHPKQKETKRDRPK